MTKNIFGLDIIGALPYAMMCYPFGVLIWCIDKKGSTHKIQNNQKNSITITQ
ncbi:MAG: hypothetical protein LBQ66_04315 [Planctomycetaceae bacterium]|nr:hypothetical protein [Planctomycetaceae bacterium]